MPPPAPADPAASERILREVARQLGGLRFGSLELQVHDGQVVAIERRERTRLAPSGDATASR